MHLHVMTKRCVSPLTLAARASSSDRPVKYLTLKVSAMSALPVPRIGAKHARLSGDTVATKRILINFQTLFSRHEVAPSGPKANLLPPSTRPTNVLVTLRISTGNPLM